MTRTVSFELSRVESGWAVRADDCTPRLLSEVRTNLGTLPQPPAGPAIEGDELAAAIGRLDRNESVRGEAAAVGRHLYACLADEKEWMSWAEGVDELRVVLRTTDEAQSLQRLPWELLHDGHRFLATQREPAVTITRQIGEADAPHRPLRLQPVVLMVIGGVLDEPSLHPAAEYLALWDTLRLGRLALNIHLLVNACADEVRDACATFKPDVVHVIAHGDQRADGTGYIELAPVKKGDRPAEIDAAQLVTLLEAGGRPEVLVITACRSGGTGVAAQGTDAAASPEAFTFRPSLAAACVARGIPLTAAMTGAISTRACRQFTLGFYFALFQGKDILAAAAEGRRTAFVDGLMPDVSIDWAYPAVFTGPGVDGTVTITCAEVMKQRAARAAELVANFRSPRPFCGRQEVFSGFGKLVAPTASTDPAALALCTPDRVPAAAKVGTTRALAQLGATAALAGHAVAFVTEAVGDDRASSLRRLAGRIVMAARNGVQSVGVDATDLPLSQLRQSDTDGPLDPRLQDLIELGGATRDSDEVVGTALRLDLAALAEAASACGAGGLVVLVDDLHQYGPAVQPFLSHSVTPYGLGTSEHRVPFVFSYDEADDTTGAGAVQVLRAWVQTGPVVRVAVEPFQPPGAWVAYQQLLLGGEKPLVPSPQHREAVLKTIHDSSQGIPGAFGDIGVRATIEAFQAVKALEPATSGELAAQLLGMDS